MGRPDSVTMDGELTENYGYDEDDVSGPERHPAEYETDRGEYLSVLILKL